MTEFTTQIRERTLDALASLRQAEADDDLHLVDIRLGELESLARTASAHDIDVPELRPYAPRAA